MHLPLEAAPAHWCSTIASDARTLYFNPEYVEQLDFPHAQFVLAHVALHCALGHFSRRAHRVRHRWDIACDHAVNLLLIDDGLKPPPGALADPREPYRRSGPHPTPGGTTTGACPATTTSP